MVVRPARKQRSGRSAQSSSSAVLIAIGVFKLVKALLLIAVGVGAIKFLHKDLAATATHGVQVLRVDPDNQFVHRMLTRIFRVTPKQLKELSVAHVPLCGLVCHRRHRAAAR
jgi:hypothetical protein